MTFARRDFLKTVGGVAAVGLVAAKAAAQEPVAAEAAPTAFSFDDNRVPMNAANFCPMPNSVNAAVSNNLASQQRDLSGPNRRRIVALKENGRERIAAMLGTTGDNIAIVRNTSEANNIIVQGLPLNDGDEILLWDQNHPSNGVAWDVRAARDGLSTRKFSLPDDPGSVEEVVDHIVAELGPRTKVISFTHISNITGFRLPAKEICAAIKQKAAVHVHVDGAQTWGAVDIDLSDIGCDSFSASSHKWFMGPRESGILYVANESIEAIWPHIVSIPWGNGVQTSQVGARKFEALGQRDNASLAALDAAADFHERVTPAGVEQQSMAISDYLREGTAELGVPMISPTNPDFTSSVVILRGQREQLIQLVGEILQDAGVIVAPVNGLRLSPHIYNSTEHIDRVVASIAKFRHLLPAV